MRAWKAACLYVATRNGSDLSKKLSSITRYLRMRGCGCHEALLFFFLRCEAACVPVMLLLYRVSRCAVRKKTREKNIVMGAFLRSVVRGTRGRVHFSSVLEGYSCGPPLYYLYL